MRSERMTRHVARWVVVGAVASGVAGLGGCLQILGDDGTFIERGTGGGGTGGTTGGTGGVGATGGGGTGTCMPDDKQACYTGPQGTESIGNCKAGEQTCAKDGTGWGDCIGEVIPTAEDPKVVGDEGCDGYAPGEAIWSAIYGDSGAQTATGGVVDPSTGDVFVVGTFESAIKIGADPFISKGGSDVFVARISQVGIPIWALQVGAMGNQEATGVSLGTDGTIVLAGYSDAPWMPQASMLSAGLFVERIDGSGNPLWSRSCGGGDQSSAHVTVNSMNEVIVGGGFTGQLNCGDQIHTAVAGTGPDIFLARISSDGSSSLWSFAVGDGVDQEILSVAVDSDDNMLFVGSNKGSFTLGGDTIASFGNQAGFIGKFTSDGQHVWSQEVRGNGNVATAGLAVDALGGMAVSGTFGGDLYFGANPPTSVDMADGFIARLNANGDVIWVHPYGAAGIYQAIVSVAIDQNDDIALAGAYFETMDFDGEMLPADPGYFDGFFAKVAGTDGSRKWAKTYGRLSILGGLNTVAVTPDNFVLAVGQGEGTLDLGNGPLTCSEGDALIGVLAP